MTRTYYNADITVRLRVMVASDSGSLEDAREAAKRAAALRPGVRAENIREVYVTPLPPAEEMRMEDRRAWQERQALAVGTCNQRERWACGYLPEAELLELARNELFGPFGLLMQRRKMVFAAIAHPKDERGIWRCVGKFLETIGTSLDELVVWSTSTNSTLTSVEWLTLGRIRQAVAEVVRHPWMGRAPGHVEEVGVQVREHRGVCKRCGQAASQRSALVSIQWAGRVLSREYVL